MSNLQAIAMKAAVGALQVAAEHVAAMMRLLVDVECTAHSKRGVAKDRRHSAEGEPPRRESGFGQESIIVVPTAIGAHVGPKDIGIAALGGSYMAMWDREGKEGRRPWLSTWMRFKPEMDAIVKSQLKAQLGGRS